MYAATAFIIMEAGDIMLPRLGLPDWTVTFIIILLIIGFPIAVIFSWIFDITPEGLKKTESAKVAKGKTPPEPVKRKLRVGDLIIAVLVVIVVILAYPRVFKSSTKINAMTNTATIVNEFGEKEKRQVFKEEYIHKLMILPFESEETDTVNPWLKYGILDGIWNELLQFPYIQAFGNPDAEHLQEQIKAAQIKNYPYFLTGTYKVTDGYYKITSRLHQTKNGEIEKERIFEGNDLFSLFDSISLKTRIDLGVPNNIINSFTDLPFKEYVTESLDAYRYFILGGYSYKLSTNMYGNFSNALEQDSTFALASFFYADWCHYYQNSKISARKYISHAMRHRQRLTEYFNIYVRIIDYLIFGELEKATALLEMQYELHPNNFELLLTLINTYYIDFSTAKGEDAIKKLNEIVPDFPDYQIMLARNYLLSDDIDKGLKFTEKRIEENPENSGFLSKKGHFLLHKGDLDNAEKSFQKAILLSPENEEPLSLVLDHINFARNKSLKPDDLQKFTGRYKIDFSEYYADFFIHNDHLMKKADNMVGSFHYPVSDTSFVGFFGAVYESLESFNSSFCINEQGKVFKFIDNMSNNTSPITYWKQDSLILQAEELLESNRHQEALNAFQKAYSENPEHYYLANFIKHLEFIQSEEYEETKSVLETYKGEYGDLKIFKEDDKFFIDVNSLVYRLLPLSEDQFMNPSSYNYILQMVIEDNQISGFKAIVNNGDEFFNERTSEQTLAKLESDN